MAQSAYCKKCGREMLPGGTCPICGGKLTGPHTLWRVSRRPVLSWIAWNTPLRLALPALLLVGLIMAGAEAAAGPGGLGRFLDGPMPALLGWMLLGLMGALGLILLLQGKETLEITADKSGVTMRVLLPRPTALQLLAHFRSPGLMKDQGLRMEYGLLADERRVAWKDIRRVQLWPEKAMFLLYGPKWWLRMAVPCDREGWREMSALTTEKLGKKKGAVVPPSLRPAPAPGAKGGGRRPPQQTAMDEDLLADIARMNAESEENGL